jgi:hypothetical protein
MPNRTIRVRKPTQGIAGPKRPESGRDLGEEGSDRIMLSTVLEKPVIGQ